MDAAERALLEEAVGAALAAARTDRRRAAGASSDGSRCWPPSRATRSPSSSSALGATNRAATALDDVVVSGARRGHPAPTSRCCSRSSARGLRPAPLPTGTRTPSASRRLGSPPRASCWWWAAPDRSRAPWPCRRRRRNRARCEVSIPTPASIWCGWSTAAGRRGDRRRGVGVGVALGRRAVAHQMLGASRTMLELARAHASERVQFGRPIASFQAVRHRLADALVAVEALEATLNAAADEPNAAHGGAREGDGGPHRADGRGPLPAGARRDRLHHGPSVSPLSQAHDAARRPLRIGRRDRPRPRAATPRRRAGYRHSSSSEKEPAVTDFDAIDFFRDTDVHRRSVSLLRVPAGAVPSAARAASRRGDGHGIRRGDLGVSRHCDVLVVQLGDRAVPGLPGAARRRRRQRAHRAAPRRAAVQRSAPDARPADAHRAPRAADAADHAEAPARERGVHVAARRSADRRVHRQRRMRVRQRVRQPVRPARDRGSARRAGIGSRDVPRPSSRPGSPAASSGAPIPR